MSLSSVALAQNALSGSLPDSWGLPHALPTLSELQLSANMLSGESPCHHCQCWPHKVPDLLRKIPSLAGVMTIRESHLAYAAVSPITGCLVSMKSLPPYVTSSLPGQ